MSLLRRSEIGRDSLFVRTKIGVKRAFRNTALILSSLVVMGIGVAACSGERIDQGFNSNRPDVAETEDGKNFEGSEDTAGTFIQAIPHIPEIPVGLIPNCKPVDGWKIKSTVKVLLGDYIDRILNDRWYAFDKSSGYNFSTSLSDPENANPFSNGWSGLAGFFISTINRISSTTADVTVVNQYGKRTYLELEDFWAGGFTVDSHIEIDAVAYTIRFYGKNDWSLGVPLWELSGLEFDFHGQKWKISDANPSKKLPDDEKTLLVDGGWIKIRNAKGEELELKSGAPFDLDKKWKPVLGWNNFRLFEIALVRKEIQYLKEIGQKIGVAGNPNWRLCYDGIEEFPISKIRFELVWNTTYIEGKGSKGIEFSCKINAPYLEVTTDAKGGVFTSESPRKINGDRTIVAIGPVEGKATECDLKGPGNLRGRTFIETEDGAFDFTTTWAELGTGALITKFAYPTGEADILVRALTDGTIEFAYVENAGGQTTSKDLVLVIYDPMDGQLRSMNLVYNNSGSEYVTIMAAGPFLPAWLPFNRGEGDRTERGTLVLTRNGELMELGVMKTLSHSLIHFMVRNLE
ncbi:hypothetical protein HYT84_01045 [Candidatus Micrarchaeota archaeon]|nr:hypothetical protein [Candidatus Micrarchaeota archaeon]